DLQPVADRAANARPRHQPARTQRHIAIQEADLSGVSRVEAQIDASRGSDLWIVAEVAVELFNAEVPLAISRVEAEAIIVRPPPCLAEQLEQVSFKPVAGVEPPFGRTAAVTGVDPHSALREEFQVEVRNLLAQIVIAEPQREVRPRRAIIIKPPHVAVET